MSTPTPRRGFVPLSDANPEERTAHASEYAAYAAEAMEQHLAQISAALGGQNTMKQLIQEVQRLRVDLSKR